MEEKKRSFTELKETMDSKELKDFCTNIAYEYAQKESHFTSSYFSSNYYITKKCFYRILEEAIVKSYIPEEVINKMMKKAILNQQKNVPSAGATTLNHYFNLRKKRRRYMIKQVAEYFAQNPQISKYEVAEKYGLTTKKIDSFLQEAFIENIVNDKICKLIEKRSLKKDSSDRAKEFFEQLWEKRKNNKKDTLN